MANTEPTFFRRFQVFARVSSGRRGLVIEPVIVTLGFKGAVDPESGMVLNLADIDIWVRAFIKLSLEEKHLNRWAFCRWVKNKLKSLIHRNEFNQIHFEFHDLSVEYIERNVFLKWRQTSLLQVGNRKWISPVILVMKTKVWPPLSSLTERKIIQSLKTIKLDKQKWDRPGLIFAGFEYLDPELGVRVRV